MIAKWPEYVFIDDGSVQEVKISNQVRTDFNRGFAQSRPLNTLSIYNLTFDISVSLDDYDNFDIWLNEILRHRSQFFLMKCPIRGVDFKFRFLDENLTFRKFKQNMLTSVKLERLEQRDR